MENLYFIKFSQSGVYQDINSLVDGVRILKIDGLYGLGKPVNIYTAKWINDDEEDFLITKEDIRGNPIVIRENIDIEITFIVSNGSTYTNDPFINVGANHDEFIGLLMGSDVWIKSDYSDKEVRCVCLEEYRPTTIKLKRQKSYILGTIKLHTLAPPVRTT